MSGDEPARGTAAVTIQYGGLLVVAIAAFAAPLLARAIPRRLVPPVVLEVVAGIVVGPQALNLVQLTGAVEVLYLLGFGFLLFLAGQEIRPEQFRGPAFRLSAIAFAASLVISVPAAAALLPIAPGADLRLLALALTASTLGVIIPVLRDAREISTGFGQLVAMSGSVGEFGALILLTILFSAEPESTAVQLLYLAALAAAAIVIGFALTRLWQTAWFRKVLLATDESTAQLRVRAAFVVLLLFAGLAHRFGVDSLLGAFIAGIVLNVSDRDERPNQEAYWGKLRAIGFGFLVPVFFIGTGVGFDVRALLSHPEAIALVPALIAAILVARGAPALLYRRRLGTRPAIAAGLLQATTLTFPVVVSALGRELNLLSASTAAALIGAALLSVLLFPALALALRPWSASKDAAAEPDAEPTGEPA
ncbi:MAG TPA: cation:proton antiporter [Streptosporangiaceae bacterium]